jgi:hypothetical protein
VALAAGGLSAACSSAATHHVAPDSGATTDAGDASAISDGSANTDGSADAGALDASLDAVDGPGEAGAPCTFNRDCPSALRCECDLDAGCACAPGPRGTGKNGIDRCDGGNDCASSLCVEGPGGVYYCSGECVTAADCTGALPLCADIAFVGRICVREAG